ncbi:hypothetical protein [Herbaspirillum sp. SJZ107]|uniref:hypothetical protein n=1 Tax=Herbaspirillum sp. SJZ107 TaxID=2572881 RepID=UPI00115416F1|nr:hypothetical protein [Herbaspirillum sp. SJZ107]TQK00153.1 hypothetical protein FBX97_5818 [Herbaspirillum sp. SJZ107]
MSTFSIQINAWIQKTKDDADKIVRYALEEVDKRLVYRSPVGDADYWQRPAPKGYTGGRFKGNWQMSVGSPATGETGVIDKDGSATLAAHKSVISAAKAGEVYYLVNTVPYAKRLEQGWSRQAPVGVVAITVVEWNNIIENVVNGVKAGTSAADFAQGWQTYKL